MGYRWLIFSAGFLLHSFLIHGNEGAEAQSFRPLHLALVTDSPEGKWARVREIVMKEVSDLLEGDFLVCFSSPEQFQGDGSAASIQKSLREAWKDDRFALVVAIGPIASHLAGLESMIPKPTFAPFIIDPSIQGMPNHQGTSGVDGLNYLSYATKVKENLQTFQQLVPFQQVSIVFEETLLEALPALTLEAQKISSATGIHIDLVPIRCASQAMDALPRSTQAVYLLPLFHQKEEDIEGFAEQLKQRKIPSFSLFSRGYIDLGFLMSDAPDSSLTRLARRVALNIQQTLDGEDPSRMPVEIAREGESVINMETLEKIELSPPYEFLLDATLLYTEKTEKFRFCRQLTLSEAVSQGLAYNLELDVIRRGVLVAKQDVFRARSRLYPQIEIDSLARIIDRDRAEVSKGTNPQSAVFIGTNLSQMLYSNRLIGDAKIQAWLQYARICGFQIARLDIAFLVSKAYLRVLREKTLKRIQRNNLSLSRLNLKMARQRVRIGAARKGEVYRWESEVSGNKTQVIETYFRIENAETELNRLLNLPQDNRTSLEEVDLCSPCLITPLLWLKDLIHNENTLERFSRFATREGFRFSPELKEVENRIRAQEVALGVAQKDFYTPEVFLGADWQRRVLQGGAASKDIFSNNRNEYQAGIHLVYPLSRGGEKFAERMKAWQELYRLRTDWCRLSQLIEEQIRISIQNATASYNAIALAEEAAATAKKNFQLVQDAYAKGGSTIVDLLDAQNQALNAELLTANAIYDFLTDLMVLQRAMGRFDFELTPEEKEGWCREIFCLLRGPA